MSHDYEVTRDARVVGGYRLTCRQCGHDPSLDSDRPCEATGHEVVVERVMGAMNCSCAHNSDGSVTITDQTGGD